MEFKDFFRGGKAVLAVMILVGFGGTATAAGEAPDKQVMSVVLSFYSPVEREGRASYNYEAYKNSGDLKNYPLPLFPLPEKQAKYGTQEYAATHYRAAVEHLRLMKNADFDVALFDMLPIPDYDPQKPLQGLNEPFYLYQSFLPWLKAGETTGMKVGIFADVANQSARYPKRREIKADEWVKILSGILSNVPDSPALWHVDGKIGIIHFGTDVVYERKAAPVSGDLLPDGGWRQVLERVRQQQNKPFFFVADVRPHDKTLEWNKIADAAYIFAPAAPAGFMTDYQRDIAPKFTIPYYWFVSPGYYREGTSYTMPEFQRIHAAYQTAMKADARRMVVMSWNDMGEDHDIWPSVNKGYALLDVIGYYNAWFKNGRQPAIETEKLLICYPLRVPEKVTTRAPAWGGGKWVAPPFAPQVSYWALLKQPRTLKIAGAGEVKLPAGLSMGTLGILPRIAGAREIPVTAILDAATVMLPSVKVVASEKDGGLQERYLNLLEKPLLDLTRAPAFWDIAKNSEMKATLRKTSGNERAMDFTTAAGIHNWGYLRGSVPAATPLPLDARLVKIRYHGVIPPGMKMLCVLQQPDNVAYVYDGLPLPSTSGTEPVEVLIPLNWFKPASWSKKTALRIPTAPLIRYVNIGPAGPATQAATGNLTLSEFSFQR